MTTYVSQPLITIGLEYYNKTHGSHDNISLNLKIYMSQKQVAMTTYVSQPNIKQTTY